MLAKQYHTLGFEGGASLYYNDNIIATCKTVTECLQVSQEHEKYVKSIKLHFDDSIWGVVLMTSNYTHFFESVSQAIDAITAIVLKGENTKYWDNNQKEHRCYDNDDNYTYEDLVIDYSADTNNNTFEDNLFYHLSFSTIDIQITETSYEEELMPDDSQYKDDSEWQPYKSNNS